MHTGGVSTTPDPSPFEGYRTTDPEYRRITIALFFAGIATFATLYSTQALLLRRTRSLETGRG